MASLSFLDRARYGDVSAVFCAACGAANARGTIATADVKRTKSRNRKPIVPAVGKGCYLTYKIKRIAKAAFRLKDQQIPVASVREGEWQPRGSVPTMALK
jgi:hypothetical protein